MQHEALKTKYLYYLMNLAQIEAEGPDGYLALCKILFDKSFIPIVYFDENRCEECQRLRYQFTQSWEQGDILNNMLPESGNFMELLIVLIQRLMFETNGSQYESDPRKWFMELLHNADLDRFNNDWISKHHDSSNVQVSNILSGIMMRWFNWDGEGSFFPLKNPHNDQRYQ